LRGNTIKKFRFSPSLGLLPLFVLAHFSHHVVTALMAPLLPMIRTDFGLDYTQSGLLISAFTLSYGISQLPAGWLADRFGPRFLITIGICGVALAGLLVGLSQTYIMMIAFLVLMGVAGGGYHPAAPTLISSSVESRNRGRALGFHQTGGSASYFVTPLIGVAIATAWGWRGAYIGLAVPTILFGTIFYALLSRRTNGVKKRRKPVDTHGEKPPTPGRLRRLVLFMILTTFTHAVLLSLRAFIPLFMVDYFGIGVETAAAFFAISYTPGLWAAPLGGYLSDRFGRVPVILLLCFISGPIIYMLTLIPYGLSFGALLLIFGTVSAMRGPGTEAYIVGETSERYRSTILGIYFFSGHEGSGILTPVMGFLIDKFGFYTSFTIVGGAVAGVALTCSPFLLSPRD
jgi:MFS family permease